MGGNNKKKILFVNHYQFGYHIDYFQYCKFLKNDFDITYICWDYRNVKIKEPGINILYIPRSGNKATRNLKFIFIVLNIIRQQEFSLVFIHFFRGVSILAMLARKNQAMHLDIRTGSISTKKISRLIYNNIVYIESKLFRSQSIISAGLRKKLRIRKDAYILPLGALPSYNNTERLSALHLLYVGTFNNRHIEDTIIGLSIFIKENPQIEIHYTIVGSGLKKEIDVLQNRINQLSLQNFIDMPGYINHNELERYYIKCNVGVSYVPVKPYYEYQPATKTYEYLMAGMPVIATETYANKQIITDQNGVIIKDNPACFAQGIIQISKNFYSYSEVNIRKSVEQFNWENIIKKMKGTILP